MHSLLDTYLKEVAGHLANLPAARRAEELREVRTHLENAVIVGREMGQPEDEAARAALAQFGTPGETGENLARAWRREQRLNRRSLFGATACTAAVAYLVNYFVGRVLLAPSLHHSMSHAQMTAHAWTYLVCFGLIVPVSAGIASAVFFTRKAILGAMLGQAVFQCWWWGQLAVYIATAAHPFRATPSFFYSQAGITAEAILLTLFVAWAVSRLRMAGQRRRYQAAAK